MASHTPITNSDKKHSPKRKVFTGTFIQSKSLGELEIWRDTCVCVDEEGVIVKIAGVRGERDVWECVEGLGWDGEEVVFEGSDGGLGERFFFPGFIDTHIHAPQYPNSGLFGSSTLLNWLNTYTFPLESSLSSLPKAHAIYSRVIQRTLSHGTTTAAYYATIHVPSTNLLADLCLHYGQRALIGRCCMDSSSGANPAFYRDETPAQSLDRTNQCVAHCEKIDPNRTLITAILTPRFAPSCTRDLMVSLGQLAAEKSLPIQTHISENVSEIAWVAELFPECESYAAVYDRYGCLTGRTVLAHAVHISEGEARLIRERGSGVAHCPVSNSALSSGMARVRWMLERGLKVGLGTDVSGGFSASVLVAAREASCVSRCVAAEREEKEQEKEKEKEDKKGEQSDALSVAEVLYLATRGGAEVLGMEDRIGGFAVGMQWDAQMVGLGEALMREDGAGGWEGSFREPGVADGPVDIFGWESWEERVAKWVFNGDDRNTLKVWVRGRLVHERK